jgi:pantoate--beta-alanine ligase
MSKIGNPTFTTQMIARDVLDLRKVVAEWRQEAKTVALVPTMGAIHAGHLSLISEAKSRCDRVIASVFVNPTQFDEDDDLDAYPANEEEDVRELASVGTDLVFCPNRKDIYPEGFSTIISVSGLTAGLCGPFRPGHFDGVVTVVAKLFLQSLPDIAIFGEKDYQQLLVIRQLAKDLNIPVEIVGAPIVREEDGLAMSSRNRYLSKKERLIAPEIYRILKMVSERIIIKPNDCELICRIAREKLIEKGFEAVDYITICHAETLQPLSALNCPARIFVAARLGQARLIDNLPIN